VFVAVYYNTSVCFRNFRILHMCESGGYCTHDVCTHCMCRAVCGVNCHQLFNDVKEACQKLSLTVFFTFLSSECQLYTAEGYVVR
jgi:hypothetical protein